MKDSYKYFNANPQNKHVSDCVIRALSRTPGYDWNKVYDELCVLGKKYSCPPNNICVYHVWLEQHGYVAYGAPLNAKGKRYTIRKLL